MFVFVLSVLLPRNVPGSQTGGYPTGRSHSYDARQGNRTTHATYEDPYPQPHMPPRVQPGMPMPYDPPHWQASQQSTIGPGPRSEYVPSRSVPPADFPHPPVHRVVRQQSPRAMSAHWFSDQGSVGSHNALGSYSPRSANFPYNSGGFVGQQNPPPTAPPRSQIQGPARNWNAMAGSNSNSGQSARPPAGLFCQQPENPRPPYRGLPGVQDAPGPYP